MAEEQIDVAVEENTGGNAFGFDDGAQAEQSEEQFEEGLGVPEDEPEEGAAQEEQSEEELVEKLAENAAEAQSVVSFLASKGIDYDSLVAEYSRDGKLSEQTYRQFDKAGLPRSMVDAYCAGQQALYESWVDHVKGIAGGEENYAELMKFASATLSDKEKEAYDIAVNSGDMGTACMAVEALLYRYNQEYPDDGYDYEGNDSDSAVAGTGFKTLDEAVAAQEDPRMYTDPEYAKVFNMRLMKTPFLKQ